MDLGEGISTSKSPASLSHAIGQIAPEFGEETGALSTQIPDASQQTRGTISKGRLEAFSDSVFAVAATLLVLGLKVPQPDGGAALSQLLAQWPAYATYAVSFMTVGIVWSITTR